MFEGFSFLLTTTGGLGIAAYLASNNIGVGVSVAVATFTFLGFFIMAFARIVRAIDALREEMDKRK